MPEGVLPALMFAWRQVELEVFRHQSRSFAFFSPGLFLFSQSRSLFYPSLSPGLFCKASPSLCDQNLMCHSVTRPKKYAVAEIFTKKKIFLWTMTIFQIVIHETQTQPIFFLRIIFKVSVQTPPEVEVEPASEVSLSTYYPIMMRTNNITSSNSNTKVAISEGEGVTLACLARCYNTPTAISCRPHICHFFSTNVLLGLNFSPY